MIQIIFFDIDGTLICKDKPLLERPLVEGLNVLREKGVKLMLSTGRNMQEIQQLGVERDFRFDGYVTMNGGYCRIEDEVIYDRPIYSGDMEQILALVEGEEMACGFADADSIYVNKVDHRVEMAQQAIHSPVPEIKSLDEMLSRPVYQVNPFCDAEMLLKMVEGLEQSKATQWHDYAYDIIPEDSGKDAGIRKALEYFGLSRRDAMAFGDASNDLDMMSLVEHSVAMENAEEEVKAVSSHVTGRVEEGGVLQALRHFDLL